MKASEAIRQAKDSGVSLWVEGNLLRYEAIRRLDDDTRQQLKQYKTEIIQLLIEKGQIVAAPVVIRGLRPCLLCHGRIFIHPKSGGFFCRSCQPGHEGIPVKTYAIRERVRDNFGLPCAGCGSTSYKPIPFGYTFPDGTKTNGWSCGGGALACQALD